MGRLGTGIGAVLVAALVLGWLARSERDERPVLTAAESSADQLPAAAGTPDQDRRPAAALPREQPEGLKTYEIAVDVMTHVRGEKSPLAGIEVALGSGGKEDPPRWIDEPVLARGVSDEQGRVDFRVQLPWQEIRAGDVLWVRVESDGYQKRTVHRRVSHVRTTEPLVLWVREGGTLFGRVRTDSGAPAPSAEVALYGEGGQGNGFSKCDFAGRFALDYRTAGRRSLHARASGQGSGSVQGLDLSPHARHEDVTVVVRGAGVLAGRVLDLSGNPVRGLPVWAEPARADPEPTRGQVLWAERDGGLWGDRTTTGTDGSFRFESLASGSYVLLAPPPPRREPIPYLPILPPAVKEQERTKLTKQALSSSAYPTGTEDLELRIELHRIEVSVFDAQGQPVDPSAAVTRGTKGESTYILTSRDPPALTCQPIAPGTEGYLESPARSVSGNVASFRVAADREYFVTWADPRYPLQERQVTVSWETFLTSVRFDLPEPTGKTRLKLDVKTPDGRPFVGNKQIRVRSARSGKLIASTLGTGWNGEWYWDPDFSTALPPGTYRVRVTANPHRGCIVRTPLPRAPYAPAEFEVEVPPGVTTLRNVRLGSSGWLELDALGPRTTPDRELVEELRSEFGFWVEQVEEATRKKLGGQEACLTSLEDGSTLVPRFETQALGSLVWGGAAWVVRGYPARSLDPIPVGRYRLRIGPEDAPLVEQTLEIRAETTTTVAW